MAMADEHKKRYWLHRVTGGENGWLLSYPLLYNHGIMSIGWSFISNPEMVKEIKGSGIAAIDKAYENAGAEISTNRYCLLRFINKMKKGDVVIIPDRAFFGIYKVADDIILTNEELSQVWLDENMIQREGNQLKTIPEGNGIDLGFYRKVIPICIGIPRNLYASPSILRHMHTLQTNAEIKSDTIGKDIQATISAYKKKQPFRNDTSIKNEEYSRWLTTREHSWPYRIFRKCNDELMTMYMAQLSAKQFTYQQLKNSGAKWSSPAYQFLYTHNNQQLTIKDWSDSFNKFENWSRLNQLMVLNSAFESYLAAIIKLTIESDPAILVEAPHTIDGIKNVKYEIALDNIDTKKIIESCTKGTWSERVDNLKKLFMKLPPSFTSSISSLEEIRVLRNNIGHAFGRDIEKFQTYDLYKLPKMNTLSFGHFRRLSTVILQIAKDIDTQVMLNNIGNFQPLYYYHTIQKELEIYPTLKEKAQQLKTRLFIEANDSNYSTSLCEWVISYYDSL